MAQRKEVIVSTDVVMEVWYDKRGLTWIGQYRNRHTQEQIGNSWWGVSRDHVLVFSPNVPNA